MLSELFWEKYFRTYDILNRAIPYQELIRDIIKFLSPREGEVIFDAGSGTGNIALAIHHHSDNTQVIAMDFSSVGIGVHQKKDKKTKIIQGNLLKPLPFNDKQFDKVVSNNVIYTIPLKQRSGLLKELYRVMKPGGVIVVANLNTDFKPAQILIDHLKKSLSSYGFLKTLVDFMVYLTSIIKIFYYNFFINRENSQGEYSFLTVKEQEQFLENAGFDIIESTSSYAGQSIITKAVK